MNCPKCGGTGFVPTNVFGVNGAIKCDFCDGTGVFITNNEEPMTNEEWRKNCSTEEFAETPTKVVLNIVSWNNDPKPSEVRHILKSWLKQPHI